MRQLVRSQLIINIVLVSTFLFSCSSRDQLVDSIHFPDPSMQECVKDAGIRKIKELKILECEYRNIESASGIEKLTALTHLFLAGNMIEELDVSQNINLISLQLYDNRITSIDISNNLALIYFSAEKNLLTCSEVENLKRHQSYHSKKFRLQGNCELGDE